MKNFRYLHDEIYGSNVYYVKCSRGMYTKMIKREFNEIAPEKADTVMATFEVYPHKGIAIRVVWLAEKAGIDQLVHECFHLTHDVMQDRGLYLTDQSDEAYAYFMQFVFKKMKVLIR